MYFWKNFGFEDIAQAAKQQSIIKRAMNQITR